MPEIFAKRDTCWNKFVHDKVCADVIQTNIHETIFHISPRRLSLTAGHGRAKRLQTPFKNPQQHRLYRRVHFFFYYDEFMIHGYIITVAESTWVAQDTELTSLGRL